MEEKKERTKKIIVFIATTLFLAVFLVDGKAEGQTTPQFLISWQAKSYVPDWYQGKIFPTKGSFIKVSFELIDQGAVADISKSRVRWYVNDKLFKNEESGLGLKSIQFAAPDYADFETEVRISVLDYKNQAALDKIVTIPSAAPEIALLTPAGGLSAGKNVFEAAPFFFNIKKISDLSFEWKANSETISGDSPFFSLEIDQRMPKSSEVAVSAAAKNKANGFEFANKTIQLKVK